MSEVIIRWTMTNCHPQGFKILAESMRLARIIFKSLRPRFMLYYNQIKIEKLERYRDIIPDLEIIAQSWSDLPIPNQHEGKCFENGQFLNSKEPWGGSLWKLCPPRTTLDSYEIHLDNDLIVMRWVPIFDLFFSGSKTLALEDKIRFFGVYDKLFEPSVVGFNSGLIGLPPGFDLGKKVRDIWEENGKGQRFSHAEEQALTCKALISKPYLLIRNNELVESNARHGHFEIGPNKRARPLNYQFTDQECGFHFLESNRYRHAEWNRFKRRLIPCL